MDSSEVVQSVLLGGFPVALMLRDSLEVLFRPAFGDDMCREPS